VIDPGRFASVLSLLDAMGTEGAAVLAASLDPHQPICNKPDEHGSLVRS